jgi:YHS domain-containing protein
MLKWVLIAAALFALYKLITNDRGRKDKDEIKAKERKIATGEMVKDPVCGAYVDIDSSIKVRDGKTVHHFCGYECRQKYLEELQNQGRDIPQLEKSDEENEY